MYYTIYQIRNKINNKIYIGKHQTHNINDSYYGSGKAIVNAIKYYGKDNFEKEILFIFETEDEMNAKETEIITEDFVSREDTYNLGVGGEGGAHFKGKTHTRYTKERIRNSVKLNGTPPPNWTGRTHSEEAKKKIAEARRKLTGKKMWITNGAENKLVNVDTILSTSWIKGRTL